jgi:hypothetical protein
VRTTLLIGSKQDRTIKRIAQSEGCGEIASKISHGHNVSVRSSILYEVSRSGEGYVYNAVCKSNVRSDLKKYKASDSNIINADFCVRLLGIVWVISHDRSYRFSKRGRFKACCPAHEDARGAAETLAGPRTKKRFDDGGFRRL